MIWERKALKFCVFLSALLLVGCGSDGTVDANSTGSELDINLQMDDDGPLKETLPFTFTLVGGVLTITETTASDTTVLILARAPN